MERKLHDHVKMHLNKLNGGTLIIQRKKLQKTKSTVVIANLFISFFALIVGFKVHAQFKTLGQTQLKIKPHQVVVQVKKGFHFNIEAPTFVKWNEQKLKPISADLNLLVFPKKENSLVSYYVCDDQNTVCENHQTAIDAHSNLKKGSVTSSPADHELQTALLKAKLENKFVLIDFGAIWCPACIRLQKEVIEKKSFQEFQKKIIFVSLDVDEDFNIKTTESYHVFNLPTLILLDSQGQEIYRWADFVPGEKLISDLNTQMKSGLPLSKIELQASNGDLEMAYLLAENKFQSGLFAEALPWYEKSKKLTLKYYECLIWAAERKFKTQQMSFEELQTSFEKSFQAFPDNYATVSWWLKLAGHQIKAKKDFSKSVEKGIELAKKFLADPKRLEEFSHSEDLSSIQGIEKADLYGSLAEFADIKKDTVARDEFYQKVVDSILQQNPTPKQPLQVIYLIHYMKKIRPVSEVLVWYKKMEKAYPNDQTYVYRHANFLAEKKSFDQSLPLALRAYSMASGKNKVTAGILLFKIYRELKKTNLAGTLLTDLKSQPILKYEKVAALKNEIDELKL